MYLTLAWSTTDILYLLRLSILTLNGDEKTGKGAHHDEGALGAKYIESIQSTLRLCQNRGLQ